MEFTQAQKDNIQAQFEAINKEYADFELRISSLSKQIQNLENTLKTSSTKLGWKEKFLGGNLGGNKVLINEVNAAREKKLKLENSIADIKMKRIEKPKRIKKEFSAILKEIDPDFTKLASERSLHFDLYQASKSYAELVKKAHQGVIDALLFLSWEKLINHPEASEKLSGFKKETLKYQKIVDRLKENTPNSLEGKPSLLDLIKFSSQDVAMSSFNKLLKQASFYKNYTDRHLTKSKKLIEEYRESAYQTLLGSVEKI